MKGVIWGTLFLCSISFAQTNRVQNNVHPKLILQNGQVSCKTCHTCDVPTKQNPCLVECPRFDMITVQQSPEKGPDVVTLDEIQKDYLPVIFSHRVHSQMSEMSGGCATCHHYNTSGPIQPCKNCHEANRKREDISKPDLKGAYHRLCMDCHRQWSHSTNCTSCHELKSKNNLASQEKKVKEISGKIHPKVNEPTKVVFNTNSPKGKFVTFYHNEHTKLFSIDCVNCHKNENCIKCHDVTKKTSVPSTIKSKVSFNEQHQKCFTCHGNDPCTKCHMNKEMQPFDHAVTAGWKLNKFHKDLECQKCHGNTNKFAKLDNTCTSCHKNFVAGKFKHEITGVKLSEVHAENDCGDCHINNNFAVEPSCDNCHEGFKFPAKVPGERVKVSSLPGTDKK